MFSATYFTVNLYVLLSYVFFSFRLAGKRNDVWIRAVEDITDQTKAIVRSFYGSELKV